MLHPALDKLLQLLHHWPFSPYTPLHVPFVHPAKLAHHRRYEPDDRVGQVSESARGEGLAIIEECEVVGEVNEEYEAIEARFDLFRVRLAQSALAGSGC